MGVLRRNRAGQHLQIPMNLLSLLLPLTAVVAGKTNCGLSCYRWAKCMGQLDGSNRPGQLGDTGIIDLNTCKPMEGKCQCAALVLDSLSSTTEEPQREPSFKPNRSPRRGGRKFSERKSLKVDKEVKKSVVKSKRKYKRFQKRLEREEDVEKVTSTAKTTTVKNGILRRTRNKKRKLRMRKRL